MRLSKLYLIIALVLIAALSAPIAVSTGLRSQTAALLSPLWKMGASFKKWVAPTCQEQFFDDALMLENASLKEEIVRLQELLLAEVALEADLADTKALACQDRDAFFRRRYDELQALMDLKLNAVAAEVIYRPSLHTCWVNVGSKTNDELARSVVAKNSPVTVGNAIVGLIDCVGEKESLVRLITDPAIHPSVRVARGFNRDILGHIDALRSLLALRSGLLASQKEQEAALANLLALRKSITEWGSSLLAKGELVGGTSHLLRGVGFQYDFPDREGPPRELRSQNLLLVGDLLVTTGMDGVFPPGLHAAEVESIDPLQEGQYFYNIEAEPCCRNLDEMRYLFILPPRRQVES